MSFSHWNEQANSFQITIGLTVGSNFHNYKDKYIIIHLIKGSNLASLTLKTCCFSSTSLMPGRTSTLFFIGPKLSLRDPGSFWAETLSSPAHSWNCWCPFQSQTLVTSDFQTATQLSYLSLIQQPFLHIITYLLSSYSEPDTVLNTLCGQSNFILIIYLWNRCCYYIVIPLHRISLFW